MKICDLKDLLEPYSDDTEIREIYLELENRELIIGHKSNENVPPYLVIASDHKQFKYWAYKKGWTQDIKNYVYARDMDSIRGCKYRDILLVGEWWRSRIFIKYSLSELKFMLIKK